MKIIKVLANFELIQLKLKVKFSTYHQSKLSFLVSEFCLQRIFVLEGFFLHWAFHQCRAFMRCYFALKLNL